MPPRRHRMLLPFMVSCGLLVFAPRPVAFAEDAMSESERLNEFFADSFQGRLDRSPMFQSYLGIKTDYDRWNDISDSETTRELAIAVDELQQLRNRFDESKLDEQTSLSYRLFELEAEQRIADYRWRFHTYPVNQMFGLHSRAPAFLINIHRITSGNDAQAYVARLRGIGPLFDQLIENLKVRAAKGVLPPKFVFPMVIRDCRNLLTGQPFDHQARPSTLLTDFRKKLAALEDFTAADRERFEEQARAALVQDVKPAYEKLVACLTDLEKQATDDDGAWKFPSGASFYQHALENRTTTDSTADQIHQIGLREVARIHDEMAGIMKQVDFSGALTDFFEFTRTDAQFYYPNTDAGRQRYLQRSSALIEAMRGRLDELFVTKPEAAMIIKRVEPFREASAGKAFYQPPAPNGSRPGTYYVNLRDMAEMPIYQMEALAYHEGIPGHHMQLSIAQELEGLPKFRQFGRYTAYSEGWGLYCELVPKEIGLYSDPYSDFGRLAMELWRAARLVVDTGIHHKRWTRQQAINYLKEHTPNPEADCVAAINRYIVMPGQATAYKVGMLKIVELREAARNQLGERFDLREFHDVVLRNGPLPLGLLQERVEAWVASEADAG